MLNPTQQQLHQPGNVVPSPAQGEEIYEGFQVNHVPAPIIKRMLAYSVDLGIIYGVMYLLIIFCIVPFAAMMGIAGSSSFESMESAGSIMLVLMVIVLLVGMGVIYHGYFIYQEYKKGTTIGKRLFGLRVLSEDGQSLSLNQCIMRDMMRYIDGALVFPGLIAMSASERNKRLGDMLVGTLVVHSQAQEANKNFVYMEQQDYFLWLDKLAAKPLPSEVCHDYLGLAYPIFISGERSPELDGPDKQFWLQCVHTFLPNAGTAGLNQLELQQFFAEHCNQQLISLTK